MLAMDLEVEERVPPVVSRASLCAACWRVSVPWPQCNLCFSAEAIALQ